MQDWVILNHPGLMILYALGLGACVLDRRWKASKGWLTWLACACVVCAAALLILAGASLWEAAACLLVFLLLIMEVKE